MRVLWLASVSIGGLWSNTKEALSAETDTRRKPLKRWLAEGEERSAKVRILLWQRRGLVWSFGQRQRGTVSAIKNITKDR